jgi:hypothetical protein
MNACMLFGFETMAKKSWTRSMTEWQAKKSRI